MWDPPLEGWTNLGFCRWWLHVGVEDVDAQCWCRSFGAIFWSELHFQYLHGLVPQGTNKDIHRHRVMHTQDDVHESIRLPCPLSYQQEGLWLLELVQDVEVVCTCPCQNEYEWRMLAESPSRTLQFFLFFGIHNILMGILGVVVELDEVELDVVLGTHLTKALGAS